MRHRCRWAELVVAADSKVVHAFFAASWRPRPSLQLLYLVDIWGNVKSFRQKLKPDKIQIQRLFHRETASEQSLNLPFVGKKL
jgi:hypothetical protein